MKSIRHVRTHTHTPCTAVSWDFALLQGKIRMNNVIMHCLWFLNNTLMAKLMEQSNYYKVMHRNFLTSSLRSSPKSFLINTTDCRKQHQSINHSRLTDRAFRKPWWRLYSHTLTLFFNLLIQHQHIIYSKPFMPDKASWLTLQQTAMHRCSDCRNEMDKTKVLICRET